MFFLSIFWKSPTDSEPRKIWRKCQLVNNSFAECKTIYEIELNRNNFYLSMRCGNHQWDCIWAFCSYNGSKALVQINKNDMKWMYIGGLHEFVSRFCSWCCCCGCYSGGDTICFVQWTQAHRRALSLVVAACKSVNKTIFIISFHGESFA